MYCVDQHRTANDHDLLIGKRRLKVSGRVMLRGRPLSRLFSACKRARQSFGAGPFVTICRSAQRDFICARRFSQRGSADSSRRFMDMEFAKRIRYCTT